MRDYTIARPLAYETARNCLIDTLGCGLEALEYPACTKLLGPVVPGATLANGARVPGTPYRLDPVQAAFNIGTMIRWLDFNDTWLAAEWGHPSDNLGGILAVADYLSRNGTTLTMRHVLTAMIKAHEIQGVIALENSFNRVGLDHVILVKLATAAVVSHMLGLTRERIVNALSHAFVDGHALRTYRHAPNTGSRKSWAAGDATARGVRLALIAATGEMGYPSVLTAPQWGFYDVLFESKPFAFQRGYGSYVMENVLFKISFPGGISRPDRSGSGHDIAPRPARGGKKRARYREHHHPHPRSRDPDHRQEGPSRQSRRPRSLPAIYGGGAASLRTADGEGLRRRYRRRSARRRLAGAHELHRGRAIHPRLSRSPKSARSPTG